MESNKRRKMGRNSFTDDLIAEIISRVSAKHLLRFSCVSKSWCSLIRTDSHFHRLQRTALPYRPCLFIREINPSNSGSCLIYHYWIDLDSIQDQSIDLAEIHNPFPSRPDSRVVASCHDLVVLLQRRHRGLNKISVCNPITRKHVMVPPNPAGDDNVVFFGFGYDRVHNSYKLLTRVKRRDQSLELMVYDLDKGTWKRLQFGMWWKSQFEDRSDDDSHLYSKWGRCDAKCVDGAVYRFLDTEISGKKMRAMVCFLLAEEEFHVVRTPDAGLVTSPENYSNYITVFDGKLCLVLRLLDRRFEFWTVDMDHDGDGKRQWRWTELLVIPYFGDAAFLFPVCFSTGKDKILILSGDGKLFWYNVLKKEFNKLGSHCQEGQFLWYDMVKKVHRKFHKSKNPIDGRCDDAGSYVGVEMT